MSLTLNEDEAFIGSQIDLLITDPKLHTELIGAVSILTEESQERVAGILRMKDGRVTVLDLEELLLEPVL